MDTTKNYASFLEMFVGVKKFQRFSLLMLEEGDYYFQDMSCSYHDKLENRNYLGRLKFCAKCFVFEPDQIQKPVLKLHFKVFVLFFLE
jgi:hypothetical protein